jgi:spermidine synthase
MKKTVEKQAAARPDDLLAAVFISGACAMVIELAGARMVAPYLGNTIYTWAAAIGLVMAALSTGYYIGGSLADRYRDRSQFSTILLCAGLLTLAIPFLGWALLPFTVFLDLWIASIVASFILVPASICYGMVSPYAIKLTAKAGEEGGSAGRIFALSTVGSIAGTLGTGFILVPNVKLTYIFIMAALLMFLASWVANRKGKVILMEGLAFVALAGLTSQFGFYPLTNGSILYQEDTQYYHITVAEENISGSPATVLYLDNAMSSGEYHNGSLAFSYAAKSRLGYELAGPGNALVLGLAAGTQLEDVKRNFPGANVDGVDIDARVVMVGKEYFSLKDDEGTNIIIDDARRYLKKTDKKYDLVIVDAFRGMSIPYHLTTKEFIGELKGGMNGDGVVIVNVISSVEGRKSGAFVRLYNTFASVFGNVVVIPIDRNLTQMQNVVLIATDKDVTEFRKKHADEIYSGEIPGTEPLSDELNPIDLYVAR